MCSWIVSGLGISGFFLLSPPSLPLASAPGSAPALAPPPPPPPEAAFLKSNPGKPDNPGNADISISPFSPVIFLSCSANFSKSFISIPIPIPVLAPSNFAFSPDLPASPESPINISCIFLNVSSNFVFNSSSLIASNNLAVSPNESRSEMFVIIENRISCKYFQSVFLVLSDMSGVFQTLTKSIFGKKWTSILPDSSPTPPALNISPFLYKTSKKRAG